ncbi:hypothetical protein RFI_22772, partial [Reticulomyxa filosa]
MKGEVVEPIIKIANGKMTKRVSNDVFYGDFEVEQNNSNICVHCDGKNTSHSVSSQSVISLIKIQSGSSSTLNAVTIPNHLIKTTNNWTSFQIAVRAAEDIRTEIREALSGENNLLQTLTNQSQTDISSVSYYISLSKKKNIRRYSVLHNNNNNNKVEWKRSCSSAFDNNNNLKDELSPWDFFVIVKYISQECGANLNTLTRNVLTRCLEDYRRISSLSHWDLFCLIPCLNYLRSIQSNISDTRFFKDQNIESQEESKENNMKEMILDILQTDLRIRQSRDITPEIFTESYVFQLLHNQQDHELSHSILQFLFEQNKQ